MTRLQLGPRGAWSTNLAWEPWAKGGWLTARGDGASWKEAIADRAQWRRRRAHLRATAGSLQQIWGRAAEDLYSLRNRELEPGEPDAWVLNAGMPAFTGLFGRDVLTASWQGALAGPELMRGALSVVAAHQADRVDAWHDAEPGKLIHELRSGPLSELGVVPQDGYYGTETTAALFPLVLSELWHWTGDVGLLNRYRAVAERALEWAASFGDPDGDGFLEYEKRSAAGLKNQGWKDSDEAIRYPDGTQVADPIATVEEQAFHYLALCRMAEICTVLEDDDGASRHLERARTLRDAWHRAYWMPDEGFYAMALDPEKRPVRSIGSNAGHALAAGIVPAQFARLVGDRLVQPDLFSGWGVRTLSSQHPAYNPWAYHLGAVWPVENATFALGLKRYGFDDLVERLVVAQLDAAAGLPEMRLPEAIGGQTPDEIPLPIPYPQANCPQAWSASAILQLVQVLLGIYPFAPLHLLLLIRPRLPDGVEELTLHDVRVGSGRVSIRFRRRRDGTASHRVIASRGAVLVTEAPPPDAADDGFAGSVARGLLTHAPGRIARAARLALGMIDEG